MRPLTQNNSFIRKLLVCELPPSLSQARNPSLMGPAQPPPGAQLDETTGWVAAETPRPCAWLCIPNGGEGEGWGVVSGGEECKARDAPSGAPSPSNWPGGRRRTAGPAALWGSSGSRCRSPRLPPSAATATLSLHILTQSPAGPCLVDPWGLKARGESEFQHLCLGTSSTWGCVEHPEGFPPHNQSLALRLPGTRLWKLRPSYD